MYFFNYPVASNVTERVSWLIEPGAVITFSDFSSHPGTCKLYAKIRACE